MAALLMLAAFAATALAEPSDPYVAPKILINTPGNISLFDYDNLKFSHLVDQAVDGNPSWSAFAHGDRLYSVDEDSDVVRVASLNLTTHVYKALSEEKGSSGTVHLAFNGDATRMVGAAYGQGTIDVWDTTDGGLSLIKTIVSDGELGPGQESAHPHQSVLDYSGRFFIVNDLGTDTLLIIDTKDDAYKVVNNAKTPPGCGPRHGVFGPPYATQNKAEYYIVVCEVSNEALLYSLDYSNDIIIPTLNQTISTLSPDADYTGSAAGEIINVYGQDIYISNRNTGEETDNIAHFLIVKDEDIPGKITLKYDSTTSSGGTSPRMFSITNDQGTVFIGNQGGPLGVVAVGRNAFSGRLDADPTDTLTMAQLGVVDDGAGPEFVAMIGGGTGGGV